MKIAVYAGSFDPITNGHIDIIKKASSFFDELYVLIAINPSKTPRLSLEEREISIKEALKKFHNVFVDSFDGYTVDFAKKHNASYLVRGLRNESDIDYELDLLSENKKLEPKIETVFFMANEDDSFISSSKVIELAKQKKDISKLVPLSVIKILEK